MTAISRVTVNHGDTPLTLPDGTPLQGNLAFRAPDLMTADEDIVGGTVRARVADGEFSVQLIPNDADDLSPTGWTYRVTARFTNGPDWVRHIAVTSTNQPLALGSLVVPDPAGGTYLPVVGPPGGAGDGALLAANNLSDVDSAPAARGHLGLGGAAVLDVGTTSGHVVDGADSRLSDARTPTSHAASHGSGGSDPVTPAAIGALTQAAADGRYAQASAVPTVGAAGAGAGVALSSTDASVTNARTPTAHATNHAIGGSDVLTPAAIGAIASGVTASGDLSGTLPSPTVAKVNGVAVPATPTAGQVLTATSGTAASWQSPPVDDAYHPADNNMLWATENPRLAQASPSPSNASAAGKLLLTRMVLRRSTVISNINFGLAGVDTTGPLSSCYFGIYDSTGTLRASTADVSSTLMGTATPKDIAFTTPYSAVAGEYFIAMLLNGTWTSSLTFKSTGGGVTANIGLTAPHLALSNYGAGQTTLPSTITLSSQATNLITGGVGSTWYGIS